MLCNTPYARPQSIENGIQFIDKGVIEYHVFRACTLIQYLLSDYQRASVSHLHDVAQYCVSINALYTTPDALACLGTRVIQPLASPTAL